MKKTTVTRYGDFNDFGDFITTAKKVQGKEDLKALSRDRNVIEAKEALNKLPDYIWERLQEAGYITREPLRWLGTRQLFAYFVAHACDKYDIKKIIFTVKSGRTELRNLKPFEIIFNIPGLRGRINDNENYEPVGYREIDKILQK